MKVQPNLQKKAPSATPTPTLVSTSSNKPLRVLCVDDSASILTLLKQILSKNEGFEIVGTAIDGLDASKKLAELKPDIMTLDIHMPNQNGIEYLEKNYGSNHPPVVMITSVSRENAELAGKALSLGASDYVEKPALTNLSERGEEIRSKLKSAFLAHSSSIKINSELDKSFQLKNKMSKVDDKMRIISLPLSSRSKLKTIFNELNGDQPATILFVEGAKDALVAIADTLSKEIGKKVIAPEEVPQSVDKNQILLFDLNSTSQKVKDLLSKGKKISILVLGDISSKGGNNLLLFSGAQLIIEDMRAGGTGKSNNPLADVASYIVPVTSFAYHSHEFFSDTLSKAA